MSPKDSGATAVTSEDATSTRSARPPKQARKKPAADFTPPWWVPTSLTLMVLGLVWVMTYYITSGGYPVPGIDMFNIAIGFGFIMVGFIMLTRWK